MLIRLEPWPRPILDLGPPNPAADGLGGDPKLAGDPNDDAIDGTLLLDRLVNEPDSPLPKFGWIWPLPAAVLSNFSHGTPSSSRCMESPSNPGRFRPRPRALDRFRSWG